MGSIIIASGPAEGEYYPLEKKTVVVGRDGACPIQIVDEQISRVHLEIRFDKQTELYYAKDLNSVNGVTVNGNPISDIPLNNGDLIAVGGSKLMFFTRQFPDRQSAWNYYKMADQRSQPTMVENPKTPAAGKGFFRRKQ